jgi:hypothetical protein
MWTFASLMDFSQSSLQSIWLFRGHILGFLTADFSGWGRQPHGQPPTWTRTPYLYSMEIGWPNYTPRHRVPILVAFYDMHGLQWDYSFPRSPHGELSNVTKGKLIPQKKACITPNWQFQWASYLSWRFLQQKCSGALLAVNNKIFWSSHRHAYKWSR